MGSDTPNPKTKLYDPVRFLCGYTVEKKKGGAVWDRPSDLKQLLVDAVVKQIEDREEAGASFDGKDWQGVWAAICDDACVAGPQPRAGLRSPTLKLPATVPGGAVQFLEAEAVKIFTKTPTPTPTDFAFNQYGQLKPKCGGEKDIRVRCDALFKSMGRWAASNAKMADPAVWAAACKEKKAYEAGAAHMERLNDRLAAANLVGSPPSTWSAGTYLKPGGGEVHAVRTHHGSDKKEESKAAGRKDLDARRAEVRANADKYDAQNAITICHR